jgi:hypothetical protein
MPCSSRKLGAAPWAVHFLALWEERVDVDQAPLRDADHLAGIPGVLIHGRPDVGGLFHTAWKLARLARRGACRCHRRQTHGSDTVHERIPSTLGTLACPRNRSQTSVMSVPTEPPSAIERKHVESSKARGSRCRMFVALSKRTLVRHPSADCSPDASYGTPSPS